MFLFHGTKREHLPSIRAHGLQPKTDYGISLLCLTEDLYQARVNAYWHLAGKHELARILVVDARGLPLESLGYVTCPVVIEPDRIRVRSRHCRHRSAEGAWHCNLNRPI